MEFQVGAEFLLEQGFEAAIHPQVSTTHWMHAGDDGERAEALMQFAFDPAIDLIWCARGGYGAAKTLPILDRLTADRGVPPKKLLVGYSDVTVVHEFVRNRWNWSTLHAAMPAAANFSRLPNDDWPATRSAVLGQSAVNWPWSRATLRWITPPPTQTIDAPLIGGNLSLWQTLAGTPYAPPRRPHLLFLEDLAEAYYRIDRMMTHVEQSGLLDTAVAIVLGDFTDCRDESNTCLAPPPPGVSPRDWLSNPDATRQPLRPAYSGEDMLREVFTKIGLRRNLPIAIGLPVGHGPNFAPLPLGAKHRLSSDGSIELVDWDWLGRSAT